MCNEEHFGQLLQDCHRKLTSLQEKLSACETQKEGSAGQITDEAALKVTAIKLTDPMNHVQACLHFYFAFCVSTLSHLCCISMHENTQHVHPSLS